MRRRTPMFVHVRAVCASVYVCVRARACVACVAYARRQTVHGTLLTLAAWRSQWRSFCSPQPGCQQRAAADGESASTAKQARTLYI